MKIESSVGKTENPESWVGYKDKKDFYFRLDKNTKPRLKT